MRERSIRRFASRLALLALIVPLLSLLPAVLHAQPEETLPPGGAVTFRWNPPLGVPLIEANRASIRTQAARGKGVDSLLDTSTQVTFRRGGAQQYEEVGSLASMKMVQDEQQLDLSRLLKILQGQELVIKVAGDGRFLGFSGGANLLERARQVLSAEAYQALRPQLDDKEMAANQKADWLKRVEFFAGKTFTVGLPYTRTSELELPGNRKIQVLDQFRIVGREHTADCDCVRLEIAAAQGPGTPAGTTMTGRGTALVDPATGLLWRETIERTVRTKSQISEGFSAPVTLLLKEDFELSHPH
ncbi:MAG TPA: hypothetical protein VFE33_07820 [Thermoanaerobaculia bacterium]|nr:hypothetical protein [Thermoanaerobaculia bacterium]